MGIRLRWETYLLPSKLEAAEGNLLLPNKKKADDSSSIIQTRYGFMSRKGG